MRPSSTAAAAVAAAAVAAHRAPPEHIEGRADAHTRTPAHQRPRQPPLRSSVRAPYSSSPLPLPVPRRGDGAGEPAAALQVLCACDTFKGTLSPDAVGQAVEVGYRRASKAVQDALASSSASVTLPRRSLPPVTAEDTELIAPTLAADLLASAGATAVFTHVPMSDGGAGLLDSVTYASTHAGGAAATSSDEDESGAIRLRRVYVPPAVAITGPLGTAITTAGVSFACDVRRRVLVVEMAEAAGLPRIAHAHDRHPGRTTSYGVGELLRYALRHIDTAAAHDSDGGSGRGDGGVRVFIGIGGSATNDGGLGALQALGLDIYVDAEHGVSADGDDATATGAHADGVEVLLTRPLRGEDLAHITRVHISDAMRRIFPYLQRPASTSTAAAVDAATASLGRGGGGVDDDGSSGGAYVSEVCLICDVDNPLVGARGATRTFGPQKCGPPPPASPSGIVEDAAVGAITSSAQQRLLDTLESGMQHAAARVVASTWRQLRQAGDAATPADGAEAAALSDLLHSRGGGGAGGMSGFFRYLLRATYAPGADVVGGLLGLYETPRVAQLLGDAACASSSSSPVTMTHPRGRLFHACDVLVTGEGSMDAQTVSSHKTVGRLIEMSTAANAYRLWRHYCHDKDDGDADAADDERGCRCITDVVVVCGRCGYDDYTACQSAVLQEVCATLLTPAVPVQQGVAEVAAGAVDADAARVQVYTRDVALSLRFWSACGAAAVAEAEEVRTASHVLATYCVPSVTVLPLTPSLFPVSAAMQQPRDCIESAVTQLMEEAARRASANATAV